MTLPPIPESTKRTICTDVAMRLGANHGRMNHYSREQVEAAMRQNRMAEQCDGWAVAVYCSRQDFEAFSDEHGMDGDYDDVRREMSRHVPTTKQQSQFVARQAGDMDLLGMVELAADTGGAALDLVGAIFEGLSDL